MGEVGADWFTVYLIPETLRATGLGGKGEGATVNLEIEAQTQVRMRTPGWAGFTGMLPKPYPMHSASRPYDADRTTSCIQDDATRMNMLRCVKRP